MEARIEKACQLMVKTDLSLAEVALEAGFSSQSHMNASFRKVCACTPKEYRISNRRKLPRSCAIFLLPFDWSEMLLPLF